MGCSPGACFYKAFGLSHLKYESGTNICSTGAHGKAAK
jgi:hypothetical protein